MKKKRKLKNIKAEIWEICKWQVRARDKDKCQRCGKHVEGTKSHTSHVLPKGSCGNHLHFDFMNLKILCYSCHLNWHGSPMESYEWFAETFPKRWDYLQEKRKDQTKYGRQYLEDLLEEYKEKY